MCDFDLDGTLTRSEEGIWNCVRYAAEKLGFPVPDAATLRKFIGPPLGWSFMEYMGMSEEMANKAVYTYRERYEAVGLFENRVYPGIRRLLRTLHRDGWYIGIATGKPQRSSERIIEHFGLNRYITKIVGPKDGRGADKELLIRQALPEDAGEAWMVGDRRFDMEGAKKVGIGAIGAGYGYGSREELMNSGCDVYCETVENIIRHLCPGEEAVPGAFLSIEGMDGSGKRRRWRQWRMRSTAGASRSSAAVNPADAPSARRFARCCLTLKTRQWTRRPRRFSTPRRAHSMCGRSSAQP